MRRNWAVLAACLLCGSATAEDAFRMEVMDAFMITGRGLVVTGQIESGTVTNGAVLCLESAGDGTEREVTVGGIEMFRKMLDSASAGQQVGLLLEELGKGDADRGDVLREEC